MIQTWLVWLGARAKDDLCIDRLELALLGHFVATISGCQRPVSACEELSRACAGIALALLGTSLGTEPILVMGNDEQKKKYLPRIAEGKTLAAFALTEAEAGSDAAAVRTRARRDGDSYVLDGTKQWITNGGEAEIYTVIASTNPARGARGLSAFIVEKGMEGYSLGSKENKMGIEPATPRSWYSRIVRCPKRISWAAKAMASR